MTMVEAKRQDAIRFTLYVDRIIQNGLIKNIEAREGRVPSKLEMIQNLDCVIAEGITGAWIWRWKGEIVFIRKALSMENPLQLEFAEPEEKRIIEL
jgi:hypothetical protein